MADGTKELVLVTGGSGYIGSFAILQCLRDGYRVRTTVRSSKREKDILDMLKAGEASNVENLSFAVADLSKDDGWPDAVAGCTYVLHIASPFPDRVPKDENELIVPAREGSVRVLRAARDAGVKRVVLTSSFAAVGYGQTDLSKVFNEESWTNPNGPDVNPYIKSKTLAERAAWEFIDKEGGSLELATIQPVLVLGPLLGGDFANSVQIVQRLLNGEMPGLPQMNFGIVDVRDIADLHVRAMTNPNAKGQRFIGSSPPAITLKELALLLRERLGKDAKRVQTRTVPNFMVRLSAFFDPAVGLITPELSKYKQMSSDKATTMLGWKPRPSDETVMATAESLKKYGLLKKT